MLRRILGFFYNNLDKVFIGAFVILTTLFLFLFCYEKVTKIPTKSVEIFENRNLATFPEFSKTSWKDYPNSLSNYFSDNLPLRTIMIRSYRRLWADCLPPLLNPIIKGSEGHKFARLSILNYRGYKLLSLKALRGKKVYLAGQSSFWNYYGADFYSVFIPDKPSVYKENLLKWVGDSKGWSKQIVDYLSDLPSYGVNFKDFTPVLVNNLDRGLLYNKESDLLHWNGNALAVTYDYFVRLFSSNKNFQSNIELEPFTIFSKEMETNTSKLEIVPWMSLNKKNLTLLEYDYSSDKNDWTGIDIVENSKVDRGTILFLTDSCIKKSHQDRFGSSHAAIFPTAHHVHKQINAHSSWSNFMNLTRIAKEQKPNIVVDEFVEWLGVSAGVDLNERKRFFLAGSMILDEKKLILSPEYLIQNISGVELRGNEWVELGENGEKVVLDLPALMPDEEGVLVVVAKIYSASGGKVLLTYSQAEDKRVPVEKIERSIAKGMDYLYMPIYAEAGRPIRVSLELSGIKGGYRFYPFPKEATEFFKEDN